MFFARLCTVSASSLLLAFAGCGGGAGGGGGGSSSQPAYENGTMTGQFGSNDLGFYLGVRIAPESPTASTPAPTLEWDIGNGFSTTKNNIIFRVSKNGDAFALGTITSIAAFGWEDISLPITPGAGTAVYRIEIDPDNTVSETNENNNWVEFTVDIPAGG